MKIPIVHNKYSAAYFFYFLFFISCFFISCKKASVVPPTFETLDLHPANGSDVSVFSFTDTNGVDSLNASTTNYYGDSILYVNYFTSPYGISTSNVYVKFDSASMLPPTAKILVARLYLYGIDSSNIPQSLVGNTIPGGGNSFSNQIIDSIIYYDSLAVAVYNTHSDTAFDNTLTEKQVTSAWNPKTITYNSQPSLHSNDTTNIAASASQWNGDIVVDVTNLVMQWFQNPASNFGINISITNTNYGPGNFYINHQAVFYSSSAPDPTKRPELIIVYQ